MNTLESAISEVHRVGSPLHTHFQDIIGMPVGRITERWDAELTRLICLGAIQSGVAGLSYYGSDLFLAVLEVREGVYQWRWRPQPIHWSCSGIENTERLASEVEIGCERRKALRAYVAGYIAASSSGDPVGHEAQESFERWWNDPYGARTRSERKAGNK